MADGEFLEFGKDEGEEGRRDLEVFVRCKLIYNYYYV